MKSVNALNSLNSRAEGWGGGGTREYERSINLSVCKCLKNVIEGTRGKSRMYKSEENINIYLRKWLLKM